MYVFAIVRQSIQKCVTWRGNVVFSFSLAARTLSRRIRLSSTSSLDTARALKAKGRVCVCTTRTWVSLIHRPYSTKGKRSHRECAFITPHHPQRERRTQREETEKETSRGLRGSSTALPLLRYRTTVVRSASYSLQCGEPFRTGATTRFLHTVLVSRSCAQSLLYFLSLSP